MNERFSSSTATLPNEWGSYGSPAPSWGTEQSYVAPRWDTSTPSNPYLAYEPKPKETVDYSWGSAPSFYDMPNSAAPNILPYTDNYSRLAELKERGGDMLRRVVKLGGSAVSKTVEIAKGLVSRRDKQSGIDYSVPAYQSNFFPAENSWSAPSQPAAPPYESSWGYAPQPAAPSYEQPWNTQPSGYGFHETYQSTPESRIGGSRLRGMFDSVGSVTQNTGNYLSTQFNRLPPEAQTMARGIGRGALNGVLEDYTKTKRNGKKGVKYTAVARAAVNPTGAARRAVTHGIRGARQGGVAAFADVRSQNANINTAASLASSAYDISRRFKR